MSDLPYYFNISRAADLKDPKERVFFRFLEILPGLVSWTTLIAIFVFSWLKPVWVSFFIIGFIIYWLIRTIYFSFHLRACYRRMRENEKKDWLKIISSMKGSEKIYHLVVLAMYTEPIEVVRESFESLMNSQWPNEKMIVVLSYEEKGKPEAEKVAETIKNEFGDKFFKLLTTCHPKDLPGDIPGKGSNETWGARKAKKEIVDVLKIPYEDIIYSSFDVDTKVFPKYFSCLTYYYLIQDKPTQCSFQPIPFFINNIWETPLISRVFSFSATFWQMMCQERPEQLLTFSSHSMSFKALVEVGFRQTNIISDDSRIFWQGFLMYNGDYKVVPLYYPISMDANCDVSFIQTMKNVYKQQKRWAYGCGDIAYFIFGFYKNRKISFYKKLSLGFSVFEGHWSWATNSIMIFLLGWLPIVIGGRAFGQSVLAYNLPIFVSRALTISMIGLISSGILSITLLPPKPPSEKKERYASFFLEWFLLPLVMIFFTSFPALDAQTRWMFGKYMGFWTTPKIRKK
jgi:hypothetical protein